MSDLKNPTYKQLMEGAKRHLKITYIVTKEIDGLELSENGVHDMVFAKNELGQANIVAEKGNLCDGVSDIVVKDWFRDKTAEGNK